MHHACSSVSRFQNRRRVLTALSACSAVVAMGVTASAIADDVVCNGAAMPPELVGEFVDEYGHQHSIDQARWHSTHDGEMFISHICSVSPGDGFLIAQNDPSQSYHPMKFSRFEWFVNDDGVWYCQQVFSANSRSEAEDFERFPAAEDLKPDGSGCGEAGGFAWTNLTPG